MHSLPRRSEASAKELPPEDGSSPRSEPSDAAQPSPVREQGPAKEPPADFIALSPAYQANDNWRWAVSLGKDGGWLLSEKEVGAEFSPLLATPSLLHPLPLSPSSCAFNSSLSTGEFSRRKACSSLADQFHA